MKDYTKLNNILANVVAPVGLLLVLLATAVPFFLMHNTTAIEAYPFVYGAGALILLAARLMSHYEVDDMRLKRLYRLERWSPILFLVGLAILFFQPDTLRDWLAFTMAGAAVQVYTGFAIPMRRARLNNDQS